MTPQRALICTYGTRGDVEPSLALAKALQTEGVEVLVATSVRFQDWIEAMGIACYPMSDESLAIIETPDGKILLEGGVSLFKRIATINRLKKQAHPINDELMRQTWEATRDFKPDFIVYHPKLFAAPHVAEKLGIPAFLAVFQPVVVPTSAFPPAGLPRIPLPGCNRLSYQLVHLSFSIFRKAISRFRQEILDLPPIHRAREVLFPAAMGTIPVLHAFSHHVLPRPDDWPDHAIMTGYWRLDKGTGYTPPPKLAAFIEAEPPPVFIGFGSMTSADPKELGQLVTGALRKAGQRGVVARGWADLAVDTADDIMVIEPTPYDWLFPQMAAVVHHGGAGTTAEGFHAGVPCAICPFFGDQPSWARISVDLGVGATPVPRHKLTEDTLAAAIDEAVSTPALRSNAKVLAGKLAAENGTENALRDIFQHLENR